jgi:hypothetical protein
MLPPELQAFSRLPFWHLLFFLLSVAILVYSAWSLSHRGGRQSVYYLLLGAYLVVVQLPEVLPPVGEALHLSFSSLGFTPRFFVALPAVVLFIMGVRYR